jgi:hypothetical protein
MDTKSTRSVKSLRIAAVSAIRKLWDSADTHMDYSIGRNERGKDPRIFHVETVIEYLEEMLKLAKSLR